jgi:dihydroorotase
VTPLLVQAPGRPADLLLRGGRLLDPAARLDDVLDLLVRDGCIAAVGRDLDRPDGVEEIDAAGATVLPAFVDPHVHLRVPGQEHKEDLVTGTRAAAAGGYGVVLSMPNTDPVLDSGAVLSAVLERAASEASVPVGFLGAVSLGRAGTG